MTGNVLQIFSADMVRAAKGPAGGRLANEIHKIILPYYLPKRCLPNTTRAMPPSIMAADSKKWNAIGSETKITPPNAAITGTDSWATAAKVADKPRSAVYQMVYPVPDAIAPDSTAKRIHFCDK